LGLPLVGHVAECPTQDLKDGRFPSAAAANEAVQVVFELDMEFIEEAALHLKAVDSMKSAARRVFS
jgi:hypothetical protein